MPPEPAPEKPSGSRIKRWWNTLTGRWGAVAIVAAGVGVFGVGRQMDDACLNRQVPGLRAERAGGPSTSLISAPVRAAIDTRLDSRMTALQFAGTEARATQIVAAWRAAACDQPAGAPQRTALDAARTNLSLDWWLIGLYVVLGVLVALNTARRTSRYALRLFGLLVAVLVILAGLADVLENVGLRRMLDAQRIGSLWPALTTILATVKLDFLALGLAYVAVVSFDRVLRATRNERERDARRPQSTGAASTARQSTRATSVPEPATSLKGADGEAAALTDVITHELRYIAHHRRRREDAEPKKQPDQLIVRSLVGIALSGGGIRSATSNLGMLQGLARLGILPFADYLSTVSGGGYIGTCLSTLLSLNGARVPAATTNVPPATDPHAFAPGDRPAFTTRWPTFPFRDDRRGALAQRAADLIGHLRTHGNFLIARRGVLKRDTMRAVGNIVSGIVYNVAGFGLVLFIVAAAYLATARALAPSVAAARAPASVDVGSAPRPPQVVVVDSALRPPRLVAGEPSTTLRRTRTCGTAGEPGCDTVAVIPLAAPTVRQRFTWEFARIRAPYVAAFGRARADTIRVPLLASLGTGALCSALALTLFAAGGFLLRRPYLLATQLPGESWEEAFEKGMLRVVATVTATLLVAATIVWQRVGVPPSYQIAALALPFVVLLSARLLNMIVALVAPFVAMFGHDFAMRQRRRRARGTFASDAEPIWSRRFRSQWGAYQAVTIYGMWGALAFMLALPVMYTVVDHGLGASLGALGALGAARFFTPGTRAGGRTRWNMPRGLQHLLLGVAVFLVIALGVIAIGAGMLNADPTSDRIWRWLAYAALAFLATGLLVDNNKFSPHYFYRDRLAETYLRSELPGADSRLWTFRDAMEIPLSRLHGDFEAPAAPAADAETFRNRAPYQLISAAINLAGSRDLTRKDRKSGYWLFSKLYCGSTHTGFRPTAIYRNGETKVARAITISGAAASSAMGFHTFFAQSFATVLFNVRLGYWLENPARPSSKLGRARFAFWPSYLWREVTMATTENERMVNLSDGGHTGDNVGIYPLLQRRCKVIIACDAEQDASLRFGSFTELLRQAYVDDGISIDIDLSMIRPDPVTKLSRSHCAVGRIRYPDRPDQVSYLIYLKNSLTGDEPEAVLNYNAGCPDFPHESTADLFFDDAQFESYRALGIHIVDAAFSSWVERSAFGDASTVHDFCAAHAPPNAARRGPRDYDQPLTFTLAPLDADQPPAE